MKPTGPTLAEQMGEKWECAYMYTDDISIHEAIEEGIREYSQRVAQKIRAEAEKWSGSGRDVDKRYVGGLLAAARILEAESGETNNG